MIAEVYSLNHDKESPEERRERMRQEELKGNPGGSSHGGGLQDLIGDLGWKGTCILILLIIIGIVIYLTVFN